VRASDDDEEEEEEDDDEEEVTEEEGDAVGARGFAGASAPLGDTAASSEEEEEDMEEALGQYELLAKRKRIDGYELLVRALSTAVLPGRSVRSLPCSPSARRGSRRQRAALTGAEELEEFFAGGALRRRALRSRKGKRSRGTSTAAALMPAEAGRKLADATLLYMNGDTARATPLLQDVIRLAPGAPDGYSAMAALHEARGDGRRALDFKMIAAHLTPRDALIWRALAQQSVALGNSRQAIYCLTRVLRLEPEDPHARWDRSILYSEIGELRKAAEGLEWLRKLRPTDGDVATMLARMHHRLGAPERACELLDTFVKDNPDAADATLVNMLAEVLIELGRHAETLALLDRESPGICVDGAAMPLDLSVKGAVCHAYLGDVEKAEDALRPLLEASCGEFADLYLQAANAFWAVGDAARSYRLLTPLRALPEYDSPQLWARLATCLCEQRDVNGACALYEEVLVQHPGHHEATAAYAELLMAHGRMDEAMVQLARLDGDPQAAQAAVASLAGDPEAVLRRLRAAKLRGCAGDHASLLAMALPLVAQSLEAETGAVAAAVAAAAAGLGRRGGRKAKPTQEPPSATGVFQGFVTKTPRRHKQDAEPGGGGGGGGASAHASAAAAAQRALALSTLPQPAIPHMLRDEETFAVFTACVGALNAQGRLSEAAALVEGAAALAKGNPALRDRLPALRHLDAELAEARGDNSGAAAALRGILSSAPPPGGTLVQWNAFARATTAAGVTAKQAKLLGRLGSRHPGNAAVPTMHAAALAAERGVCTPQALASLFRAFRLAPRQPLVCLALGSALIQHAMSRGVADRHAAVLAAFGFIQRYAALRGNPGESQFNTARALHALGLVHLALPLYEQALQEEGGGVAREAAHNLARIYLGAGAPGLARELMRRYNTV